MRSLPWVVLLVSVACRGAAAPPRPAAAPDTPAADRRTTVLASNVRLVPRGPVAADADTLYDEYAATVGTAVHDVAYLPGDVTCYGGPAVDGTIPVELYVRRALDRAAGTIVEDVVELYPDDLRLDRRTVTLDAAGAVSTIRGPRGRVVGRALIERPDAAGTVQILAVGDRAFRIVAHRVTGTSLRHLTLIVDAAAAAEAGVALDELDRVEDWGVAQAQLAGLGADARTLTIKGELPVMDPARCAEVFSHFPAR
jgi:hypothetical protein